MVKGKQENDKIKTKPDKNRKREKARQCRRPFTVEKEEKEKKYKFKGPNMQILEVASGCWELVVEWLWETWVDKGVVKVAGKGSCRRGEKLVNSEQYFECRGDRGIEGEGSGEPTETQPIPSPTHPSTGDQPLMTESSSSHDTTQDSRDSLDLEGINGSEGDQVQSPYDSPLSGGHTSERAKDALNLEELFSIWTNVSNGVLALETVKDAQAVEFIALKARIKKLEKKCKPSISHHVAWLKSVQRLSMKKRFGKKEFVS
nr:hypothetical protein [Tanacetum cinerariifolium]